MRKNERGLSRTAIAVRRRRTEPRLPIAASNHNSVNLRVDFGPQWDIFRVTCRNKPRLIWRPTRTGLVSAELSIGLRSIRRLLMQETSAKVREVLPKTGAKEIALAVSGLTLLGLVGLSDYLTGPEISFGVFYFLPIWLMTWQFDRSVAVLFSLLCALVWFAVDDASGVQYSTAIIPFWNAAARLVYFLSFTFLLSYSREQLRQSKEEVKRLSGLLPICASCKKIRNDEGYWQEIDAYLSTHADTKFSHGICPDCAKKLYPEFADDLLKKWRRTGS